MPATTDSIGALYHQVGLRDGNLARMRRLQG